jgi:pimeloyl-ACP methyl ester carboxylesterase
VCSITFLHGVGMSPSIAADAIDELRSALPPTVRVVAPLRRGYRGDAAATSWDELVDDVAELVAAEAPTVLVGVSGGATLALAAAVRGIPGVMAAVAHEPLVGSLAPDLDAVVRRSAATLADTTTGDPVERAGAFVARLVGDATWAALPHETHAFTAAHAATVHAEVPLFVAFAPMLDELASVSIPLVVSTGALSPQARHDAAAVLASTGARSVLVDGAGHLAVHQQPVAFAALVHEVWSTATGPSAIDRRNAEDAA